MVSVGAALVSLFGGRKPLSYGNIGRASTAVRSVSRRVKESGDVERAGENAQAVQQLLDDLDAQIQQETQQITAQFTADAPLETVTLTPKRTDVSVQLVALGWRPQA